MTKLPPKVNISIRFDIDDLKRAKEKNLDVARICRAALKQSLGG